MNEQGSTTLLFSVKIYLVNTCKKDKAVFYHRF